MADFSGKEYWLYKDIEEKLSKVLLKEDLLYLYEEYPSFDDWGKEVNILFHLPSYRPQWKEVAATEILDIIRKRPDWRNLLLEVCKDLLLRAQNGPNASKLEHVTELVRKMQSYEEVEMKPVSKDTKEEVGIQPEAASKGLKDERAEKKPVSKDTKDLRKIEKDNFARLYKLIMTVCLDLFRDLLSYYIGIEDISAIEKRMYGLEAILDSKQMEKYTLWQNSRSTKALDLPLVYILLRYVRNIPQPRKGWDVTPEDDDESLAAGVERIRIQAKCVFDRLGKGKIEESDFQHIWKNLRRNIIKIQNLIFKKDSYVHAIDELFSLKLEETRTNPYKKAIELFQSINRKSTTSGLSLDILGPFAADHFHPLKDMENMTRLDYLICIICILCHFVNPVNLHSLSKGRYPKETSEKKSKNSEIDVIYDLLRHIIPRHNNGWGNIPDKTDNCLAACIDRIIRQRNDLTSSRRTDVSDSTFQDIWGRFKTDIIEIERQILGCQVYKERLDDLFALVNVPIIGILGRVYNETIPESESLGVDNEIIPQFEALVLTPSRSSEKDRDDSKGIKKVSSWPLLTDQDFKGDDAQCLFFKSLELTDLLNSTCETITKGIHGLSFAADIFEKVGIFRFLSDIKSLSNNATVIYDRERYQRTKGLTPGDVFGFYVEVTDENDGFQVEEKNSNFKDVFLKLRTDYNPRIMMVSSDSIPVIDAKLEISKEYFDVESSDNFYIHHEYDDTDEISKLNAFYKASFICDKILSMTTSTPVEKIADKVSNAISDISWIETVFLNCCEEVSLKERASNKGTKGQGLSVASTCLFGQLVLEETIRRACKVLGLAIYRGVRELSSINDQECKFYDTIPSVFYEKILSEAMNKLVGSHIEVQADDEHFIKCRTKVANALYKSINEQDSIIIKETMTKYRKTNEELEFIRSMFEELKNRCQPANMSDLVKKWEKRDAIPNREQIMDKYPSVLTYFVGEKNGKSVVKVLLKDDDNKAKAFFRQYTDFEPIFEIVKDATEINGQSEMDVSNSGVPRMDKTTRKQLGEIIHQQSAQLMENHSHIVRISEGYMSQSVQIDQACIVIYCLDKTIIPFGEKELPRSLKGYPVDVREDFIVAGFCNECLPLSNDCSIGNSSGGAGSIGMFVEVLNSSKKEIGFLTAAHVALQGCEKLYKGKKLFSNYNQGDKRHNIVHPSAEDGENPEVIGKVKEAIFSNYGISETGIDAAFVEVDDRTIVGKLLQQIAKEENLDPGKTLVTKTGRTTAKTIGILQTLSNSGRLEFQLGHKVIRKLFLNLYGIGNQPTESPFFQEGDSGSGIFLNGKDEQFRKALGIGIAYGKKTKDTLVCKISEIVEAFGIIVPNEH